MSQRQIAKEVGVSRAQIRRDWPQAEAALLAVRIEAAAMHRPEAETGIGEGCLVSHHSLSRTVGLEIEESREWLGTRCVLSAHLAFES